MADGIKDKFNIPVELIGSGGGVFEVEIDGSLVFSKKAKGRFPDDEEIFAAVEKRNPSQ